MYRSKKQTCLASKKLNVSFTNVITSRNYDVFNSLNAKKKLVS